MTLALNPTGWSGVFFGQDSDAVVPLRSQLNGRSDAPLAPLTGIIHSAGMEKLSFTGPTELDFDSPVPARIINLLNELPNGDYQ